MSQFRAAKKLDALDARIDALEGERLALELRVFGATLNEAQRRDRYFSIGDVDLRRKLISLELELHELRQDQHAAAVAYWALVAGETGAKLDDLRSNSPRSAWRRGTVWDVLTIFWILIGAGYWAFDLAGAIAGTVVAAIWAQFMVRNHERTRLASIRKGEEILRSSESQLQRAQHEAARSNPGHAKFSPAEATTGMPETAEPG